MINKLVIVGFGLIGASVAAGLKAANGCREVIAVARSPQTRNTALQLGLADSAYPDLEAFAGTLGAGDLICIAVPTLTVKAVLEQIAATVSPEVTLTDCASVKGHVEAAAMEAFGEMPAQLVLGHPIAGSEKSGVEAANPKLFLRHRVILTPSTSTADTNHLRRVVNMWKTLGAQVVAMPVAEHDEVLAATSHLPHVIAYSLVDTLAHDTENENIFRYAAGGFRDFTRIASSDPTMWHDIMLANRDSILRALDLFTSNLGQLRQAIETEDSDYLMGVFTRAKAARDHFNSRIALKSYTANVSKSMKQHNLDYLVQPGGTLSGHLRVPGDKSISHRSIMLGSIAEGVTEIEGFLEGEDALATLQAFRDMGVVIEGPDQGRVTVHGVGLHGLQPPPGALYLGNSGTSMRLLSGLLAGQAFDTQLTGDESLSKRPMNRVAEPLRSMGAVIETEAKGLPPLTIRGGQALQGLHYELPVASAQVKSCLLLAGLYAEGETSVVEPGVTRDHTERMLRGFGYEVDSAGSRISLSGGGKLGACHIEVPADISSAAFFMVAAAITPDADVTLTHVGINPTRTGILSILRLMGAKVSFANKREVGGEPVADIRIRHSALKGIDIPPEVVPLAIDEFPALFIAAACAEGTTRLTGAEELRVKESDRIQVMADGLKTLGVDATPTEDGMIIKGGKIGGGSVESHGDHRIAMAFAIAALRADGPVVIDDCGNVDTSFPGFAAIAADAGLRIAVLEA